MDWIAWDSTLATGHARMDADHSTLAGLFNLLADAVGRREGKEAYAKVLDDIILHAQAHFDLEQQLMEAHHYPTAEQHSAEHAMLMEQALGYRASFDADAAQSPVALAQFPEVWLAFHILFSDKALADFLARTA